MKEIILLKSGEIALKGLNRSTFEDIMAKNARRRLQPLGEFKIWHAQSTTYVQPLTEGVDMDEAVRRLQTVFGIVAVTKSCVVEKDFSVICPAAAEYFAEQLTAARSFKVEAKRSDKSFPMKSPEISRELGGYLLSRFHHLKVKVEQPGDRPLPWRSGSRAPTFTPTSCPVRAVSPSGPADGPCCCSPAASTARWPAT